jgi:RNA polymerase sigma-70 factor (ECF subfamily)
VIPSPTLTILQRIARGDPAAVEECLDVYGGLVWSLARRLAPGAADIDDVVQEIFITLWKTAHRFDPALGHESIWVTTVARRRGIDWKRRQARHAGSDDSLEALPSGTPGQAEVVERADEARRAAEALGQLRAEQRAVLELAVSHGLTYEQVAARLGWPIGTVKTHARRGLQRVRELLARGPEGARA